MVNSKWLNGKLRNPRSGFTSDKEGRPRGFISAPRMRKERRLKAFTLVELLVVIAIIGILAAVVMIAINPAEMARKGRDANRLSDIENVRKAIDLAVAEGAVVPSSGGVRNSRDHGRSCNGTGWARNIDLCVYLATLPIDPINDTTYQYQFNANGTNYELRVQLESSSNDTKEQNDGGDDSDWYEVGTSLTLL